MSNSPTSPPSHATYRFDDGDYERAYEAVFNAADIPNEQGKNKLLKALDEGKHELAAFERDLKAAKGIPRNILRALGSIEGLRNPAVNAASKKADSDWKNANEDLASLEKLDSTWKKEGPYGAEIKKQIEEDLEDARNDQEKAQRDLTDTTDVLNHTMVLKRDGQKTLNHSNPQDKSLLKLFPAAQPSKHWPRLLLVCNSNLGTAQSFYDEMTALGDVVQAVKDPQASEKLVTVGAFHSAGHTPANAVESVPKRLTEVDKYGSFKGEFISPASIKIAETIKQLLMARDETGKPSEESGRYVLRKDAGEILEHIVVGGYSGGYLAANDALRVVERSLAGGEFTSEKFENTDKHEFIRELLSHASVLGIAGLDSADAAKDRPWSGTNFISKHDASIAAAGGFSLRHHPDTKIVPSDKPLDGNVLGGHGLEGYREAIVAMVKQQEVGVPPL